MKKCAFIVIKCYITWVNKKIVLDLHFYESKMCLFELDMKLALYVGMSVICKIFNNN